MDNNIPTISIIVPVYNIEKYLHRCIDSILAQSFSDFEVLLIDDGSTDSSGIICDEYSQKDNRVKVFHKENGGVSSARNIGLKNANGKWITFIDSDDVIENDYINNIIKVNDGIDLVITGYKQKKGDIIETVEYSEQIICVNEFLSQILNTSIYLISCIFYHPWRKLYKRSIIDNNRIEFDEDLFYGEDTVFIIKYLYFVKNIQIKNCTSYIYTLPFTTNKYLMNLPDFERHILYFEFYLTRFEYLKSFRLNIVRQFIYNAYSNKFISYAISQKIDKCILTIVSFRKSKVRFIIKSIKYSNNSLKRRFYNLLFYRIPLIFIIIKRLHEKSCNIRTISREYIAIPETYL